MRRLKSLLEPRPIDIRFDASRQPVAVRPYSTWRPVERLLDYWRETGRWWEGEPEREFLRLLAGGVVVVGRARRGADGRWYLYAIED